MDLFTNFIFEYGLLAIFFVITIEYACFPISSEIVLPFSGAVASISHINFITVLIVSVIGGLIGTSFCYWLGRYGGKALIRRIIKKYPTSEKGINSSLNRFKEYGKYAVCFGRLIPLIRTYIGFIAGSYGMTYLSFLISSAVGITAWNTLLIGLGYYLRENWHAVNEVYNKYKVVIIPLAILLALYIIVKVRRK